MFRIKVYTAVDHRLQLLEYFGNSRILQEGYILHGLEHQLPLCPVSQTLGKNCDTLVNQWTKSYL